MTHDENSPRPDTAAPDNHPELKDDRIGVLLVNLGTPDAATPRAVRRYLAEFLSDPRVIDLPRPLWLPILHGVILNTRPAATAKKYQLIWRHEHNESPLRYYSRAQAEQTRRFFQNHHIIDWAMRYGKPSISERIKALKDQGCARILIVPLYPQYSATTTASVADAVFAALGKMRWQPAIRIAPPFYDHETYIEALAISVRRRISGLDWTPEHIVLSFHGLPQRYFDAGDPYYCHCAKTARLLREEMGWSEAFAPLAFQSKFGRAKWLEPSTTNILKSLAENGARRVAVMTPGFISDCIETLEEINIGARKLFIEAGGDEFDMIACLNDAPETIRLLADIIARETSGWQATDTTPNNGAA